MQTTKKDMYQQYEIKCSSSLLLLLIPLQKGYLKLRNITFQASKILQSPIEGWKELKSS